MPGQRFPPPLSSHCSSPVPVCGLDHFPPLTGAMWCLSIPPIRFMVHFVIHMNTPEGRGHALRSTGSTAWYRADRWWNGRMRGREGRMEGGREGERDE